MRCRWPAPAPGRSWPAACAPRSRATTTPAPDAPPARTAAASRGRDRLRTGGEEIAGSVRWLCSPGASFVVGVALPVDRGYTAQ